MAVGSVLPSNRKSEKFENDKWIDIEEPPVQTIFNYGVVFYAGNFYYFGGHEKFRGAGFNSILGLNAASWTWSRVGEMNSVRYGLGVIQVENSVMVLGGAKMLQNEVCVLNNGRFTCEEKNSSLSMYMPFVFLVSDSYDD